ncbi:hypothetical protein [Rhodoferax sp. WC2427]|uniref:hypothetical protein n=1 Tax=Rhodoferax sp. WC2427 TaxID=3234144 RepID=UPI0034658258
MIALHPDVFSFIPVWLLSMLHWFAGLIVFAESLNKLERTAPLAPGLTRPQRIAAWLKCAAWLLLSAGGAGALVTPLMRLEPPTLQDVALILGFAILIIRTRFKEG